MLETILPIAAQAYNIFSGERKRDDDKATQQQVWAREDNAVQRRMQDMQAAGMNPVLAAGSAAQSSNPVISKGAEIDPNDFLAPLQSKLLSEQIGSTQAQKALTLAQIPGVQAESSYKEYENKSLQRSGQLKTDTNLSKNVKSVADAVKPTVKKVVTSLSQPRDINKQKVAARNVVKAVKNFFNR